MPKRLCSDSKRRKFSLPKSPYKRYFCPENKTFWQPNASLMTSERYIVITPAMQDLYSTWPDGTNEEHKRSIRRLLRRLRIALFIWLISFIATVIWFSYSP